MDLSTEHKVLDLKNRIEASIVIWKRKMHQKDGKSSWGSGVSLEKRELFEERAETILIILKQRFPGIPQSALDISKIQFNKARTTPQNSLSLSHSFCFLTHQELKELAYFVQDVGQAVLESYSRIIESLAFTVLSRIEDVLYADTLTQSPRSKSDDNEKAEEETGKMSPADTSTPTSVRLSDFMGWGADTNIKKNSCYTENYCKGEHDQKAMLRPLATKRFSYLEKLESLSGIRSPTARN